MEGGERDDKCQCGGSCQSWHLQPRLAAAWGAFHRLEQNLRGQQDLHLGCKMGVIAQICPKMIIYGSWAMWDLSLYSPKASYSSIHRNSGCVLRLLNSEKKRNWLWANIQSIILHMLYWNKKYEPFSNKVCCLSSVSFGAYRVFPLTSPGCPSPLKKALYPPLFSGFSLSRFHVKGRGPDVTTSPLAELLSRITTAGSAEVLWRRTRRQHWTQTLNNSDLRPSFSIYFLPCIHHEMHVRYEGLVSLISVHRFGE